MAVSECLEGCRSWASLFCRWIMLLCAEGLERLKSSSKKNDQLTCQKFILHSTNAIYSWIIKYLFPVVLTLHFLARLCLLFHSSKDTLELEFKTALHGGWRAFFTLKNWKILKSIGLYRTSWRVRWGRDTMLSLLVVLKQSKGETLLADTIISLYL